MVNVSTLIITTCLIIATSACCVMFDANVYMFRDAAVVDFWKPMFQINGMIFGGLSAHEYGHFLQQQRLGNEKYYISVACPSLIINACSLAVLPFDNKDLKCEITEWYRSLPWEIEATELGAIAFFDFGLLYGIDLFGVPDAARFVRCHDEFSEQY